VREHHALGAAGGAAGVVDRGQILAAAVRVGGRLGGGDDLLERMHARARAAFPHEHNLAETRAPLSQLLDNLDEGVIDEEGAAARVLQRIDLLARRPSGVDRHRDGAHRPAGEEILQVTVAVQRQRRHAIAARDAEFGKCPRQPGDPLCELPVRVPPIAEDRGDAVRVHLQRATQSLCDLHVVLARCVGRRDQNGKRTTPPSTRRPAPLVPLAAGLQT
jgi:hypothetical protein